MSENERNFQYWLTELRQRESSNSTVVAITTSASLVMLALFLQPVLQDFSIEANWGSGLAFGSGLALASLGFFYREASKRIMHEIQIAQLKSLMTSNERHMAEILRAYAKAQHNRVRELAWRSIMLIPVIAWLVTFYYALFPPLIAILGSNAS